MFEGFDQYNKELIYQGLKALIEHGNEAGFVGLHNNDPGHPVYVAGALGIEGELNPKDPADSPERNRLFKMLSELSQDFIARHEQGYIWFRDLRTWRKFCYFVVECHQKRGFGVDLPPLDD
jgi:hypothetical protein